MLGLVPEAFDRRLRIAGPMLPDGIEHIEVYGLRVGGASANLRFVRTPEGAVSVEVLKIDGQLDVVVQSEPSSP